MMAKFRRVNKSKRGASSSGNIIIDSEFGHGFMFNKNRSTTFTIDNDVLETDFKKKRRK